MNERDELIDMCNSFLATVKDMTTGTETENWLNAEHGVDSVFYRDVAELIKIGVAGGWAANLEIAGPRYRRSRICEPSRENGYFSITAVFMDSTGNDQHNPEDSFRGDFHSHPYGEFNMVFPLNAGAALAGPNGWCHGGWTAPAPGSRHYPEAKGGAVIALFFLPAGRIAYDVRPPDKELDPAMRRSD